MGYSNILVPEPWGSASCWGVRKAKQDWLNKLLTHFPQPTRTYTDFSTQFYFIFCVYLYFGIS